MKKALVVTSVASMVEQFLMPSINLLKDMGYEVHVACNFEKGSSCCDETIDALKQKLTKENVVFYQINFARNVTRILEHICAYQQLARVVNDNKFELVHCHSPIGGLITRLVCCGVRKCGTKVFYTAHGFHFYKGAPLKNWLLFYPAEKICAYFTDVLITINLEDYDLARKKMKAKRVEFVPGVGIDLSRFNNTEIEKKEIRRLKREELGLPQDAVLLLSIGELNKNKNHEIVIRAISSLNCTYRENIYYIIAGKGDLYMYLQNIIDEFELGQNVKLLGFRRDIETLCKAADVFVFPSIREGLSVSLMESMASGLPIVCSGIRGNIDLVDEKGGILFNAYSVEECKRAIEVLREKNLREMGSYNTRKISRYSTSNINDKLKELYNSII